MAKAIDRYRAKKAKQNESDIVKGSDLPNRNVKRFSNAYNISYNAASKSKDEEKSKTLRRKGLNNYKRAQSEADRVGAYGWDKRQAKRKVGK